MKRPVEFSQPCANRKYVARFERAFSRKSAWRGNHRILHRMTARSTRCDSRHKSLLRSLHTGVAARRTDVPVTVHMLNLTEPIHAAFFEASWANSSRTRWTALLYSLMSSAVRDTLLKNSVCCVNSLASSSLISNDLFVVFMGHPFLERKGRQWDRMDGRVCRPSEIADSRLKVSTQMPSANSVRLKHKLGGMDGGVNRVSNVFFLFGRTDCRMSTRDGQRAQVCETTA